jgi:transposase
MNDGSAPIPTSSGQQQRFRLNRGGNRQLNAALYRIALTQMRAGGRGEAYVQRRLAAGATKREARRALVRRISDEVFRRLWQDRVRLAAASTAAA